MPSSARKSLVLHAQAWQLGCGCESTDCKAGQAGSLPTGGQRHRHSSQLSHTSGSVGIKINPSLHTEQLLVPAAACGGNVPSPARLSQALL